MKMCSAVLKLLHVDKWTEKHGKADRWSFATCYCELAKKFILPKVA
jgi:hypothetical protein